MTDYEVTASENATAASPKNKKLKVANDQIDQQARLWPRKPRYYFTESPKCVG